MLRPQSVIKQVLSGIYGIPSSPTPSFYLHRLVIPLILPLRTVLPSDIFTDWMRLHILPSLNFDWIATLSATHLPLTAVFILGDWVPAQETSECHHSSLEQLVSIEESVPTLTIEDEHFPSVKNTIFQHLSWVFKYFMISESHNFKIIRAWQQACF